MDLSKSRELTTKQIHRVYEINGTLKKYNNLHLSMGFDFYTIFNRFGRLMSLNTL